MANNQQLLRELEQALASQAALKQQRADIIHTVAISPSKKKIMSAPDPRPQPSKKQSPSKQRQLIPAGRHAAQRKPKPSSRTTIPAFRPSSPTDSQDTIGREIDAAITKSVANMLHTPVPSQQQQAPRIVAVPAQANARVSQQKQQDQALTPTFLTSKRRNMHCELDEPGYGVPFPHRKQKGFFAKLFSLSCFAPQQSRRDGGNGPPSPFLIRTPTRPRPHSAKVTPPTLKLTSEMAPLRQSLQSFKPGLAAAALAEGAHDHSRNVHINGHDVSSATAIALSEQQQPLSSGGTPPPTPQFGKIAGNVHFPPRNRDTWIMQADHLNATTPQHDQMHSEASFESLEAELSDGEGGLATPGAAMYRRTPIAGADGRPLVQKRRQEEQIPVTVPEQLQQLQQQPSQLQQQSSEIRGAEEAHASELQAALVQALSVPLPPHTGQIGQQKSLHSNAKQTQVTLAALMDPKNNNKNSYFKSHHPQQQQQHQQGGYYHDIRSAPVSPQKRVGVVVKDQAPRKQQLAAAQVAPVGASAAPISSLQGQQQYRRPQAQSAPASRAVSPLRQPIIKPRMTKASSARSEATQRLLENRRKREMAHFANLHPRAAKRKEAAMLNQNFSRGARLSSDKGDEVVQVKRPRSAQNHPFNDEIANEGRVRKEAVNIAAGANGYQIPAAGTPAALQNFQERNFNISAANSLIFPDNNDLAATLIPVPPGSPGYYQMLERLALGMSVDMARVNEAKKPTQSFVPMKESLVEENGENNNNAVAAAAELQKSGSIKDDDGFVFNPNALFSGKAELSPLVNVAAQKLVSLSDAAVARSASGSVVATTEEEGPNAAADGGIAVDASSGTLLGRLMELERSLTLSDLSALRHAIRREGGAAEAWAE